MEYKLDPFIQEDKIWLLSLKRKMAIDQSAVEKLFEIYLKLHGKYPNYNKANACGSCIVEVLNDCIAKSNEIIFTEIKIELEKTKSKSKKKDA